MPEVSLKQSDGVKFKNIVNATVFVHSGVAYIKLDDHRARKISSGETYPVNPEDTVRPATKVHVEY